MAESILFDKNQTKAAIYTQLVEQIEALIAPDHDLVASLANISALLKEVFQFHWVGFYRVQDKELVLGPFQGPLACVKIGYGKGVCGTAWQNGATIIVPDVHQFPGHIACSSLSNSEIVVPVMDKKGEVQLVLDVDSEHFTAFDNDDQNGLEAIAALITKYYFA
ncbi:MAG: GAF domain-containing protein [Flavobacteriales bacterium]